MAHEASFFIKFTRKVTSCQSFSMNLLFFSPPPPKKTLATQKENGTMTTVELKPISKQSEDTQGIQVDKKTPSQKGKLYIAVRCMKQACTPAH